MSTKESAIVFRYENPTCAELETILGSHWAICHKTPKNIERYGRCITEREYKAACELALDRRLMDGAGI